MNRRSFLKLAPLAPLAAWLAPAAMIEQEVAPSFYRVIGGPFGGSFFKATDVVRFERGWAAIGRFVVENNIPRVERFWFRVYGDSLMFMEKGPSTWLKRLP